MTDKELRELESLAVDQDRLFDPAAVIALIAEVRRLQERLHYEETCHAEAQEEVRRLQKENAYLKVKKWVGGTDFANGEVAGNG